MRLPIIVDARGDLSFYNSVAEMLKALEAIDVTNQEYLVYDAEGRRIQLGVARKRVFFGLLEGPDVVIVESEEPTPTHAPQLRACISDFLTRVGVDREWVAHATQADLVEKALNYTLR
jgi:hypothetical protein